jgi:branched-chain amino acid transport system substrate-binding protein
MRALATTVGALACALALAIGATGATNADPGVGATTIKIGGTVPLSGVASAYRAVAVGAAAYFKYWNDTNGGVNKRKIDYVYLDDAYDPSKTVEQTRRLIQEEQVFAVFNSLGTEHNLAVRPLLNQAKVPQVFVASGALSFGRDYRSNPWTIGFLPTYVAEGTIYGKYLRATKPKSKIAVLYQDDDYGKELIRGLKKGLAGRGRIVAQQGYDVAASDVNSQVARLKSSRANVFMVFATPKFAIQAFIQANKLGWRPQMFVNQVSSASNVMKIIQSSAAPLASNAVSIGFVKDPADPRFKKDPAIKLYNRVMAKYAPGADVKDVYHVYAMAVAREFINALAHAGNPPTRAALMRAVTHMNDKKNPFLYPGVTVKTTPQARFPISQAQVIRWRGGHWNAVGKLVSARG